MSNQQQVVRDVQELLRRVASGETVEVDEETQRILGEIMAQRFVNALQGRTPKPRTEEKKVHFSEIGHPCRRKLWYNVHYPELAENLSPSNIFKFMYGDLIEELYLALVRLSGHNVTDEQKRCEIELPNGWVISGYLDAKIDGVLTDVKSASTFGMRKFSEGLKDDAFGYKDQLNGYMNSEGEIEGSFHAIDKQLGNMVCMDMDATPLTDKWKEQLVADIEGKEPPARAFEAEPEGKSGNFKLPINCSYCPFKHTCWADSNDGHGLRTFIYNRGPVFLTEVKKEPKVPEYTET